MTRSAITITDLERAFDHGGRTVLALEGIDLEVQEGEFLVLLGPSGCGKTTLLRIMGGLLSPTAGSVEVTPADGPAEGGARGTPVGFVFQADNLLPWRTVRQNIELPLELAGVDRHRRAVRSRELLTMVNLTSFADAHPRQLSGGMRQRVSMARALAADPAILLLDEPFGALDAQVRDALNMELQRIWMESKKTVVLVTHSISEAVFLGDRVVMMAPDPGRISSVTEVPFQRPRSLQLHEDAEMIRLIAHLRRELEHL